MTTRLIKIWIQTERMQTFIINILILILIILYIFSQWYSQIGDFFLENKAISLVIANKNHCLHSFYSC
jgi:hypothetical protein